MIQNAKVMEQATQIIISGSSYRDQSMAANIDWILQQNPGAKVVLWAHDYHVSRASGAMGSYLGAAHGSDYVVFGQIFHAGDYNAVNNGRLGPNAAVPSFPGTVEYVLHSTGMPQFFLDMRQAAPDDPDTPEVEGPPRTKTFLQAAIQITVADLSMSLDNVLLVASIAREEPALLFIGLSFSVLFMGLAANYVARLIHRYQWINYIGLAVILWVACNMIYEGWVGGEHGLGLRSVLGLD